MKSATKQQSRLPGPERLKNIKSIKPARKQFFGTQRFSHLIKEGAKIADQMDEIRMTCESYSHVINSRLSGYMLRCDATDEAKGIIREKISSAKKILHEMDVYLNKETREDKRYKRKEVENA